jgi:methylmalonyl-CoA mutase
MGKMESFDSLFETFQPNSKADWEAKVKADLKLEDVDSLDWIDEDGIRHQAYYHTDEVSTTNRNYQLKKEQTFWSILQTYRTSDWEPDALKAHLEMAFENGLECAILISEDFSKSHWSILDQAKKKNGRLKYFIQSGFSHAAISEKQGMLVDPIANMIKDRKINQAQIEDLNEYFVKQINSFNMQRFLLVEGSIYGKMGATAVQEIAYCLRHTTEYLDLLTDSGQRADAVFRSLTVNVSIGSAYFLQIAKFRALRINLNRIQDYYQSKEKIRIWAESNPYYLDHEDFNNNLIRLSAQAMSAVLGQCDRISLSNVGVQKDRQLFADRMLRNIQLMLKDESRFAKVEDLLEGAYYVEDLTNKLVDESWELFKQLEKNGQLTEEIENEDFLKDLKQTADQRLAAFQNGDRTMVGVNKYQQEREKQGDNIVGDFSALSQIISKA